MNKSNQAQIIANYGRRFIVRTADNTVYEATARKKRVDFACGDWVHIGRINQEQVVIEDYLPRKNLLYRQDQTRSKLIAANVSQVLIVLAASPTPSETLLQRALLAAEAAHIQPIIALNKADLPQTEKWQQKLAFYQQFYPVLALSALDNIDVLLPILDRQCTILLGQSGMGKSTLINALLGTDTARVGIISDALDSGKHTTTHAQLYDLDNSSQLIDSPGLQAFGLHHLNAVDLLSYFPDMRHLIGKCRFHNCTHQKEPDCAVKTATENGLISPIRLTFLQSITQELNGKENKW
ncbi:ribosome small subunit-dependent GTPase A [Stenoxybacter acetivorans]|uniref:ribosome small subunit-dependent GTPase A n=1 Tax=Stenoxybacter acetivorans TaxID=422441 RepID=UPI00056C8E10|nr:ribosome small subunit-dependent GTPase A [Stenoxybacter acetivorans]